MLICCFLIYNFLIVLFILLCWLGKAKDPAIKGSGLINNYSLAREQCERQENCHRTDQQVQSERAHNNSICTCFRAF